ncbi:acetyl-CoA hydrolase/transferase C-terminal domain-containing protein [Luteimonas sp. e5]
MTLRFDSLDTAVDHLLARIDGPLNVVAPLALGKPHRLLNALYRRVVTDPARRLQLFTALSLDPPQVKGDDLKARLLGPVIERLYGAHFPRLDYVTAQKQGTLPAHVRIEEFYVQSGALLRSPLAQRDYASLNYTHVARAMPSRGINCIVQKVAAHPTDPRLSISCNADLTLDILQAIEAAGQPRPLLIAEIDPALPWLGNSAALPEDFFDVVVTPPAPHPPLFAMPRERVGDAEFAIGLYASTLVKDGGTLQIGIGALADALAYALLLRHVDNATWRELLHALDPQLPQHPLVQNEGGLEPFEQGLYGCSEMLNEGFRVLASHGILKRRVLDDIELMRRAEAGDTEAAAIVAREGHYLRGAFYLGSPEFYAWLHGLDADAARGIDMLPVSRINTLWRGHEELERVQRRHSRHFNTSMMATALGAAVSDALEDGRVVSGVGGQYDFVSMAHSLEGARSVLMLRATRGHGARATSNILWNYGHVTIPRHLRDVFISEYGIAQVRSLADEDLVTAMLGIADARFQPDLIQAAQAAGKLAADFQPPAHWQHNTRERLSAALAPFRANGVLPDYPLGSDYSAVEQRLLKALERIGDVPAGAAATGTDWHDAEAMQRMGLAQPRNEDEWRMARQLDAALRALLG